MDIKELLKKAPVVDGILSLILSILFYGLFLGENIFTIIFFGFIIFLFLTLIKFSKVKKK